MALSCEFTAIGSPFLSKECTGLGNTLFQIAAIYGLAKDTGKKLDFIYLDVLNKKLINLTGHDYIKTIFRNVPMSLTTNYSLSFNSPYVYSGNFVEDHYYAIKSAGDHNTCINGHFESYRFFENYKNEIVKMFEPDNASIEYIRLKYPYLFDSNVRCASIHIRKFHSIFVDDVSYYKRAISMLPLGVKFIILSNDVESVKKDFKGDFEFIDGNPDFIDMWIISMCKYNILSHSTMSWWGAYLNKNDDKIVICPETIKKQYTGPVTNLYPESYKMI